MVFLSTLLVSVLLTALSVPVLTRVALRVSLIDVPNQRKVHTRPIPRVGGLAMVLGALVPVLVWTGDDPFVQVFIVAVAVVAFFGLLDDLYDLRPRWKLAGQLTAALLAVFPGGVRIMSVWFFSPERWFLPCWISIPLTIFVIVGVTNAINLADGLDGLAGGISLLSLCCIGYLAYLQRQPTLGIIALALAGATFAFLRYNTYPASIFLGDVGSQLLGFSSITLAIHLTQRSASLSPLLPLIILGFPILDTLTVMLRRIARGSSPLVADKTHFHHVLLSLGLKQSESVMLIYLIQLVLVAVALYLRSFRDDLLLCLYVAFSAAILFLFRQAGRGRWQLRQLKPLVWIDGHFERLRRTGIIRNLFALLQGCAVLLLVITAFLNEDLSPSTSYVAIAMMAAVVVVAWVRKAILGDCLKMVLYLLIPVIIYGGVTHLHDRCSFLAVLGYRLLFVVLALLNIMVSRLTRRTHGFQSTPLDFLVLVIAVVAPLIPDVNTPFYSLGLMSAKIIICYFSCEVIFAEMRRSLRPMTVATVTLLAILALRGIG